MMLDKTAVQESNDSEIRSSERYCLARTNRVLELFQLPFDAPSVLAAGVEVLWQKAMDIVIFQGHSYQIKPDDRAALTELEWSGELLNNRRDLTAAKVDDGTHEQSVASQVAEREINGDRADGNYSELEQRIWVQLRSCYDPEIAVNIVDLGLIYRVSFRPSKSGRQEVVVQMTLTNPACSMGDVIIQEIKDKIAALPEVAEVVVELVFDPPWSYDMLSEQAKLELGLL